MSRIRGVPPGRAGRLWLQRRLSTARGGAELLDHKLRILRIEQQRLRLLEQRTSETWQQAAGEARRWSVRAGLLGGRRGFRKQASAEPVEVVVTWSSLVGVRYPSHAECRLPIPDPASASPTDAALAVAVERHRRALEAAVQHAVAVAALHAVETELQVTRRRVRAIEERWLPRLEEAVAELSLGLEEVEHSEGVRLRWSAGRAAGRQRFGGPGEEEP